ncbi:MAG TPA: sensor histidine kinase [Cyclobacteriaceae bacterium]|nr:sensor histidine kinase [Cyclobacteriaceae bacterium]
MKSVILILLISVLTLHYAHGQPPVWAKGRDSVLLTLSRIKQDSDRVIALMKFGWWWETYNIDSAAQCYIKMGELSKKINYLEGSLKYYANYTYILNQKGKYAEGLKLNLESVELARKKGSKTQLANCLFNTGSSYNNMANYKEAIVYYLQAAKVFEALNLTRQLAIVYGNIGGVFTNIEQHEKGYQYYLKALQKAREVNDVEQVATLLINSGIGATKTNRFAEAEQFLNEGIKISKENDRTLLEIQGYIVLAELYADRKLFEKSIEYAEKALEASKQIGSKYNEVEALAALTQSYFEMKNSLATIRYAEMGITASKENNTTSHLNKLYYWLAQAKADVGDFKSGYRNLLIVHALEDSINQKEITKKIEQLEISYQTAQKERSILQLQRERERQQLFIQGLLIGILAILLISALVYINLRKNKKIEEQKRTLAENEIQQLKQAQQLLAAESILHGEEEERKRLAKDLHDGLGGLLTGVKISLSNMKGDMVMTGENVLVFERSLDMLDNSISELRRVAHNMMPEALAKFGLSMALQDFCESINGMKALTISFQTVGDERRLDSSQEIILYRIVQELLNNTLKHSGAQHALVQLVYESNAMTLTVEDDGKGFEKNIIEKSTGSGWPNIRSRVEYLKGLIDVITKPEEGTFVHIRLPI